MNVTPAPTHSLNGDTSNATALANETIQDTSSSLSASGIEASLNRTVIHASGYSEEEGTGGPQGEGLSHKRSFESEAELMYGGAVEDALKRAKLDEIGLMDQLKADAHTIVPFFAVTGNIKSPIFDGIPSLTPEWLLKKVWLKINGDIDQSVLASMISKDMGPKLRGEIRIYLEKRDEVQQGNRINLKNTIMGAIEATIVYQKDKPMLTIIRDPKGKPKKEGKSERNFLVSLTPYGQSVCINELQLKKRDSFIHRSGSGKGLDSSLSTIATGQPSSPNSALQLDPKWRLPENFKEVEDELLKKNVQVGDLSSQVITLKDDLQKRDMMINELRSIIIQLKPNHPLPELLPPSTSAENVLLPSAIVEHQQQGDDANIAQHEMQVDNQQQQPQQSSNFFH